jgi:hypothetical protein
MIERIWKCAVFQTARSGWPPVAIVRLASLARLPGTAPAPLPPRYHNHSARGTYILVGFGLGDQAMWIVIATMVSLSALALLAACEDKSNNVP